MNIIIDVILGAVILIFTIVGFYRGFFATVLGFARFFLAIFLATMFAQPLSVLVYDSFISNPAREKISTTLKAYAEDAGKSGENIKSYFEDSFFLDIISGSDTIDLEKIASDITDETAEELSVRMETDIVRPFVQPLVKFILTTVLITIFAFLLALITKPLVGIIRSLHIIRSIDFILGGGLGFLFGGVIATVICMLIYYNIAMSLNWLDINARTVNNTVICRWILNFINWQV